MINYSTIPNFYIVGARKSGTTSLWKYLDLHPDIFMHPLKEPGFWVDDRQYPDFKNYQKVYKSAETLQYRGDASTAYMVDDNFIDRIKTHPIDAKFIFILRNPVDRAYSNYWFLKGKGFEQLPFKEAFLKNKDEIFNFHKNTLSNGMHYYFQLGLYGQRIKKFYAHFHPENILVIETNELNKNPLKTVNACCHFLKLPGFQELDVIQLNPTIILKNPESFSKNYQLLHSDNIMKTLLKKIFPKSFGQNIKNTLLKKLFFKDIFSDTYPAMTPEERAWTAAFYKEDVALLKNLTGLSFSDWMDFT